MSVDGNNSLMSSLAPSRFGARRHEAFLFLCLSVAQTQTSRGVLVTFELRG